MGQSNPHIPSPSGRFRNFRKASRRGRRIIEKTASATVEALETRLLLTAATWIGGTGNWNVASNWSTNSVPGSNDTVTINSGAVVSVTDGEDPSTVTAAAGSTIDITSSGSFRVGAGGNFAGTLNDAGIFNGSDSSTAPAIISGTMNVTGQFNSGYFSNTGTTNLTGASMSSYRANLTNSGTLNISQGPSLGSSTITNVPGGTIAFTDDVPLLAFGTIINTGTITKSGGAGTSIIPNGGTLEDVGGTIEAQTGTLSIDSSFYAENTNFIASAGAAVSYDGYAPGGSGYTNTMYVDGTLTGSGAGNLLLTNGLMTPGGDGFQATIAVFNFPAGFVQVTAASFFDNGDALGEITNNGFLSYGGSAAHGLSSSLTNNGTIDVTGSGNLEMTAGANVGPFVNGATGILDLESDASVENSNGSVNFTNMGLIEKTAGTGITVIGATSGMNFDNAGGAFDVQTGTISLQNGGDSITYTAGPITVAAGATFNINVGSGNIDGSGTFTSTGGGHVTYSGGSWYNQNGQPPSTFDFAPNTFIVSGAADFNDSTNDINTGAISYTGGGDISAILNEGNITVTDSSTYNSTLGFVNATTGTLNFAADASISAGYHSNIDNSGTIIKSGGSGTLDLSQLTITNAGTIEAASGSIALPNFGNNPAGSTLIAEAGAALTYSNGATFNENDGTVILGGAGASFPALAPLATNTGTFEVLSGATFTTAGALSNTGAIMVGGDLTIAGNFTESQSTASGTPPPPTLNFAVAGAPGTAAAPDFVVQGSATLAGDLSANFAGGFAVTSGTYTAATFTTAATGSFASTTGVGPAFTATVNATSIVLNATGAGGGGGGGGAADLAVSNVSAPSSFSAGGGSVINFEVTNNGPNAATGTWTDSVFLSTDGTINPSDILLGQVTHTGPLASGAHYMGSLGVIWPAEIAGSYQVVVETDSGDAVPDTNRANNVAASPVLTTVIPVLNLGGSVNGTLSAGEQLLYQLVIPDPTDVIVNGTFAIPLLSDIEIARGALPVPGAAPYTVPVSATATTLSVPIEHPVPGTYYIRLFGQPGAGAGQSFTLSAVTVANSVTGISPASVGQGNATITVSGSGFNGASTVELVNAGGNVVATAAVSEISANTLSAAFDLSGVAAGSYTLKVTTAAETESAPSPLVVTAGSATQNSVEFSISGPSLVRPNRTNDLFVTYTNTSNVDVPAPLFELTEPNMSFELAGGNPGAKLVAGTSFQDGSIQLFAIDQEGNAGELPPGYTGTYDIKFKTLISIGDTSFDATLNPTSGFGVTDLTSIVGPAPFGVSDVTAEILAAQISGESAIQAIAYPGSTGNYTATTNAYPVDPTLILPGENESSLTVLNSQLQQFLDGIAGALSTAGVSDPSYNDLFQYAVAQADGFGSVTQQQTTGAFGQGTADPLNYEIVQQPENPPQPFTEYNLNLAFVSPQGTTIYTAPAGASVYTPGVGEIFTSTNPSDLSTLTIQANGAYRVTEQDGSYYEFGQPFTEYNAIDSALSYYVDAAGLKTTFNYSNSYGKQVTSISEPDGLSETFSYSSQGVVTSSTDQYGQTTTYGYTVQTIPAPVMGDATLQPAYFLSTITTPAGTTTIQYSAPLQVGYEYFGSTNAGSLFETADGAYVTSLYPASGRGVATGVLEDTVPFYLNSPATADRPISITLPDGSGETFSYDNFGRLLASNSLGGDFPITYSYDISGLQQTATFADNSTLTQVFGIDGQVLKTIDSTGQTTQLSYTPDGMLSSILAPNGASESLNSDNSGNLTNAVGPTGIPASLTYDSSGQVTGITNGNGHTVAIAYGSNNSVSSLTFPDGSSTQYSYNPLDEVSQIIARGGTMTNIAYDQQGDITGVSFSNGTSDSFSYYPDGNLETSTQDGSGANGTTTYTYSPTSPYELTGIAYPGGQSVGYMYDNKGRVIQESDQAGVLESFKYDSDARLSQILDGSGNLLVTYGYDEQNRISLETFGNGTKTVYSYNADGKVASITNLAVGGTISSSLAYTYNSAGLPITVTDQSNNVTTYAYDLLGQLTQVTLPGGRSITYTYDADGNRTQVTDSAGTTTASYASNNLDEYTSVGSATYAYDKNGNIESMTSGSGTTTYTYDPDGQLASSTGPAGDFTYSYNALGQLDRYTDNGVQTKLLLGAGGNVVAAYTASGSLIANFTYGAIGLVGQSGGSGGNLYYQFDFTGNTTATTNSTGNTVNTLRYLPFGEKIVSTGPAGLLFTYNGASGAVDLGDGSYQMGARTYSPSLGRFVQPDPQQYGGGDVNLYRYAKNSPVAFIDPTGLTPVLTYLLANVKALLADGSPEALAAIDGVVATINDVLIQQGANALAREVIVTAAAEGSGATVLLVGSAVTTPVGGTVEGVATAGTVEVVGTGLNGIATVGITGAQIVGAVARTPGAFTAILDVTKVVTIHILKVGAGVIGSLFVYKLLAGTAHASEIPTVVVPPGFVGPLPPGHHYIFLLKTSGDPNDIAGPLGSGAARYVTDSQSLPYTVLFENEPTAGLPAQEVVITTTLDPNVNLSTFQLTGIGFGTETITVPPNLQSYTTTVSYIQPNTGTSILVQVSASLNASTRVVTWTLQTLDPTTLAAPSNALTGFLPQDNSSGQGEGYVGYSVDPMPALATGVVISAAGSVVFDTNAAISTKTWTNTIDNAQPTSSVAALPANTNSNAIPLIWGGQETGGPGLATYTVNVSVNGGPFMPWLADTTATSGVYLGEPGNTYAFNSIATDAAGIEQAAPLTPQATTDEAAVSRTVIFGGKTRAIFTDAQGRLVTITLTGPGSGTLGFNTAGKADPVSFTLTGTTGASKLLVKVAGGAVTLSDISVTGSLGSFIAPQANLLGSFDVTGSVGTLELGNVTSGPSSIDLAGAGVPTTFKLGTLHDLSITTASAIKSFSANSWTNGLFSTDSLRAVSLGKLLIKGAFDASVTLSSGTLSAAIGSITGGAWTVAASVKTLTTGTIASGFSGTFTGAIGLFAVKGNLDGALTAASIGSLKVSGSISGAALTLTGSKTSLGSLTVGASVTNSQVLSAGSIGKVSVSGASGSTFYAGVTPGTAGLPTASEFLTSASIASFIAKGKTPFADTFIGASSIGAVDLANVTTDNGGTPFGVATKALRTFQLHQPKKKPLSWTSKLKTSLLSNLGGDLQVEVLH